MAAWCGKNATQLDLGMPSILKTPKGFEDREADWVNQRTRNRRLRRRSNSRAWDCTRVRL